MEEEKEERKEEGKKEGNKVECLPVGGVLLLTDLLGVLQLNVRSMPGCSRCAVERGSGVQFKLCELGADNPCECVAWMNAVSMELC